MHTAVLFLVFNRPHTTARVFDAIRSARPPRLYVSADGPRAGNAHDAAACAQVREIAARVDWPCEVRTLLRGTNAGCGRAVASGIDWFFEHEIEGIILEDDCLPHADFFPFCEELLARYRDHAGVMSVSGDCYHHPAKSHGASYTFSRYPQVWGWATWQRAWRFNDAAMAEWPRLRDAGWLDRLGQGQRDFTAFWTDTFDAAHAGRIDTWDYQWVFSCWLHGGLAALPARNLVANIGFGDSATHTTARPPSWVRPAEPIEFPLVHPHEIVRDEAGDRWTDLNLFQTRRHARRRLLARIPSLRSGVRQLRRLLA